MWIVISLRDLAFPGIQFSILPHLNVNSKTHIQPCVVQEICLGYSFSMNDAQDYLAKFHQLDAMAKLLGAKAIQVDETECLYEYSVRPEHFNPNGVLHGGALYTIMDSSQGAFLHFILDASFAHAFTGTSTIRYEAPVTDGVIQIRTWLKGREGRKYFVSSEAKRADGTTVARLEEIWIAKPKSVERRNISNES